MCSSKKHRAIGGPHGGYYVTLAPDISSDFTHLEAGQLDHLFGGVKNSRSVRWHLKLPAQEQTEQTVVERDAEL